MNSRVLPADFIASLDRAATRVTTPNGPGQMTWRIWGKGYPLVLLHGGSGTWMHFARNIEPLARDYMVIAGDQPGFGDSDVLAEQTVTPDALAAVVHTGVEQILGPSQHFSYLGFSMGSAIAAHAAPRAGERLDRIVMAGAAGLKLPSAPFEELKSWRHLPTEAEKLDAHRRNLEILMIYDPKKVDDLAVYIQQRGTMIAKTRRINISAYGMVPERLAEASAKIAVIYGEFDPIAHGYMEERRQLIKRIQPNATFDVLPGFGHWIQYEAADEFNRLVKERLSGR